MSRLIVSSIILDFYPLSTASVLERLRWSYDHCWSNASLWNLFAYRIIKEGVYMKDTIPDCPQFSQHDIDVVITHNANSVQSADEWFTVCACAESLSLFSPT